MTNAYSRLNPDKITQTARRLTARIEERFPQAGLARACAELAETADATAARVAALARPNLIVRAAVLGVIAAAVVGFALLIRALAPDLALVVDATAAERSGVAQTLESLVNLVILAALAIWFFVNLERRLMRRAALAHLHELRSYAHVVDMHQLVKDPSAILNADRRTASSPARTMTDFELLRYLDYCTEMLAIIGKLAALYAERTQDPQIIATASDIEAMTTGLGRKIWQKIITVGPTAPASRPPLRGSAP